MKCEFCGAETAAGKFCEYCGSELPQEKPAIQITNNYYGDTAPQSRDESVRGRGVCTKCGSSMVKFVREKVSTSRRSSSRSNLFGSGRQGESVSYAAYRTVGLCQSCGHTWDPDAKAAKSGAKKNTWLWVLGWIFIFPLPLTILLLRNEEMKPALKYGLIIAAWLLYFAIGLGSGSETEEAPVTALSAYGQCIGTEAAIR